MSADIEQVIRDAAEFRGRFYVVDADADANDQIWFRSEVVDVDFEDAIMETTGNVADVCAPVARMLNAVPVLLAEIDRLRNLAANACTLAILGMNRTRAPKCECGGSS